MEGMEIRSFRRTSQSVFDLSFIDDRLVDVNGIVYCGKFPIVNVSTLDAKTRSQLYPDLSTEHNWGLLNGNVYSKISEAEEALFPIAVKAGAKFTEAVPDSPKDPMFVSLMPSASREAKCRWLGKLKPEMSDEARREAGQPPLNGAYLGEEVAKMVENLKRSQS